MSDFTPAETRMLLNALRIGAEDGSLFAQNNDGSPHQSDVNLYERLRKKLAGDPVPNSGTVAFNKLAYGAKFQYEQGKGTVWVKIGHDEIAQWDVSKIADTWIGQQICSFSEDGDVSKPVHLLPEQ